MGAVQRSCAHNSTTPRRLSLYTTTREIRKLSSEAIGYVFRYSPHQGTTFAVHLAIADTVNDIYRNETWFAIANLATKARVSRQSVMRAISELRESGDLVVVDATLSGEGTPTGRPGRYRMIRPARESVYPTGNAEGGVPPWYTGCTTMVHVTQ